MIDQFESAPPFDSPTPRFEREKQASARRERRIAARRQQILDAAERVFAAKGYRGATTREIAAAADVSEGTLYNYFADKRTLFLGLMRSWADLLVEGIVVVQADGIEDAVVQILAGQFTRMRSHRQFRLFLQEARLDAELHRALVLEILPRISQEVERLMQKLIDAGVMRRVDPEIANWTLMAAVVGLALFSDLGTATVLDRTPPEVLARQVSDIFINGLRGQA